jgi:hypothetical protein
MNKYLEKLASWKDPVKFVGYVTGSHKGKAITKFKNVAEYLAKKETFSDVAKHVAHESQQTTKARIAAGSAVAGATAAGAYGYKKYRDKQKKETLDYYKDIFKQASAGAAAKELGRHGGSAVWRVLKTVGKKTADTMNTAGGGKIKEYGLQHGVKQDGLKKFVGSKHKDQVKAILGKGRKGEDARKTMRMHSEHLNNLKNHQRDAKITLGAAGATGLSGYAYMKARHQLKEQEKHSY